MIYILRQTGSGSIHQVLPQSLVFGVQDDGYLFLQELKRDKTLVAETNERDVYGNKLGYFCGCRSSSRSATAPVEQVTLIVSVCQVKEKAKLKVGFGTIHQRKLELAWWRGRAECSKGWSSCQVGLVMYASRNLCISATTLILI